jgi:hypothetical protein
MVEIPDDLDNSVYSFMYWKSITRKTSDQYKLKKRYESYDKYGLGDIDGRKVIACTEMFGDIGDEVEVTFKDEVYYWNGESGTLFAIIGDFKNEEDSNCDEYGHLYTMIDGEYTQRSVVEFIVGSRFKGHHIKEIFPDLKKNPVIKIERTGVSYDF